MLNFAHAPDQASACDGSSDAYVVPIAGGHAGAGGRTRVVVKEGGGSPLPGGVASMWDPSRSYLRVLLRDLVAEARVGLHPWEQHPERPSRLVVNVEMFAPVNGGLKAGDRTGIVDYDHIRDALKEWPLRPHTPLLETLLDELVGLCFRSPRVEACRVSIVKPDIFNEAAAAGVEAYVRRADRQGLAA